MRVARGWPLFWRNGQLFSWVHGVSVPYVLYTIHYAKSFAYIFLFLLPKIFEEDHDPSLTDEETGFM